MFFFSILFDLSYTKKAKQQSQQLHTKFLSQKRHYFPQTNSGTYYNLPSTQVCFSDKTLKNTVNWAIHISREFPPQQPVDLEQTGTETTVVEIALYPQLLKYNVRTKVFPSSSPVLSPSPLE